MARFSERLRAVEEAISELQLQPRALAARRRLVRGQALPGDALLVAEHDCVGIRFRRLFDFLQARGSSLGDFDENDDAVIRWLDPTHAAIRLLTEPPGSKLEGILLHKLRHDWPYPGRQGEWQGQLPHPLLQLLPPNYVAAPLLLEFVYRAKPYLRSVESDPLPEAKPSAESGHDRT